MPLNTTVQHKVIDLNKSRDDIVVNVLPYTVATIQGTLMTGTWATAELTIARSNDGEDFVNLETTTMLTGEGMTGRIDVSGFAFLRASVTTLEGSAATAQITIVAKGDG